MNKRAFIKTLLAGTGVLASGALTTAVVASTIPTGAAVLYGDGVHCDTHGFEQFCMGNTVYWSNGIPVGNSIQDKKLYFFRNLNSIEFYPNWKIHETEMLNTAIHWKSSGRTLPKGCVDWSFGKVTY